MATSQDYLDFVLEQLPPLFDKLHRSLGCSTREITNCLFISRLICKTVFPSRNGFFTSTEIRTASCARPS